MNSLNKALRDYIGIRRNLGFRLRIPAGWLKNFVAFLQAEGASHITTELALRWATQPIERSTFYLGWASGSGAAFRHLAPYYRTSH